MALKRKPPVWKVSVTVVIGPNNEPDQRWEATKPTRTAAMRAVESQITVARLNVKGAQRKHWPMLFELNREFVRMCHGHGYKRQSFEPSSKAWCLTIERIERAR
jgi:hypothetical protein